MDDKVLDPEKTGVTTQFFLFCRYSAKKFSIFFVKIY